MTQQVQKSISGTNPNWDVAVVADLLVQPSVANPTLWSVTVPSLGSWAVLYNETLDGYPDAASATAAGLTQAEAEGWTAYP